MKIKILLLILFPLYLNTLSAQKPDSTNAIQGFLKIRELIRQNKIRELSRLIEYPIYRENPVPDIQSADQFILYYPILFDETLKHKLDTFRLSDMWEKQEYYCIMDGDLWMSVEGKVNTINYQSKAEQNLAAMLTKEECSNLHPSINQWKHNMYKCMTDKYLVRVDETDEDIRLVLWNRPNFWKNKPDLILTNGKQELYSSGNEEITFNNNGWTYLVSNTIVGGNESIFGVQLVVDKQGVQQSSEQCKCIK
jgi:hypothetical protein